MMNSQKKMILRTKLVGLTKDNLHQSLLRILLMSLITENQMKELTMITQTSTAMNSCSRNASLIIITLVLVSQERKGRH